MLLCANWDLVESQLSALNTWTTVNIQQQGTYDYFGVNVDISSGDRGTFVISLMSNGGNNGFGTITVSHYKISASSTDQNVYLHKVVASSLNMKVYKTTDNKLLFVFYAPNKWGNISISNSTISSERFTVYRGSSWAPSGSTEITPNSFPTT